MVGYRFKILFQSDLNEKKISRLKMFYLQIPRVVFTGADLWNNAKLPVTGDCQSFVINFPPADVS